MKIKICPKCKGDKVILDAGGVSGNWKCVGCKFTSPLFPEIDLDELKEKNKK